MWNAPRSENKTVSNITKASWQNKFVKQSIHEHSSDFILFKYGNTIAAIGNCDLLYLFQTDVLENLVYHNEKININSIVQ